MDIHYIQPYSRDKNIGGAINKAISTLAAAEDDWIVLLDHDILFLRPDSKKQIEEVLLYHKSFDVLSCRTNRLAKSYQLVPGMFEETDIREHIKCANICHENFYGIVTTTREPLAGMVLCFKVSTWEKLGNFEENTLNFDSVFCITAKNAGYDLGIMMGVYVYHLYRAWYEHGEARNNYQHLLPEK